MAGILLIGYKNAQGIVKALGAKLPEHELLLPSGSKLLKVRGRWAIYYYAYNDCDLKMLEDYKGFEFLPGLLKKIQEG